MGINKKDGKLANFGKDGQKALRKSFLSKEAYRAHMSKISKRGWRARRKAQAAAVA